MSVPGPQNIPRAISVLTLGNKVSIFNLFNLYCIFNFCIRIRSGGGGGGGARFIASSEGLL